MELTAKMVFERETKGAVRYQEVDSDGKALDILDSIIGTLYIRKTALNGQAPKTVTVIVS
jgi:hypothetical protein